MIHTMTEMFWFFYAVLIILALVNTWIIVQLRRQQISLRLLEETISRFPVLRWQLWQLRGHGGQHEQDAAPDD